MFKNRYFTRDFNSCLNMIRLAEHIIGKKNKFRKRSAEETRTKIRD